MVWGGLRWFVVVCGNSMDRSLELAALAHYATPSPVEKS